MVGGGGHKETDAPKTDSYKGKGSIAAANLRKGEGESRPQRRQRGERQAFL